MRFHVLILFFLVVNFNISGEELALCDVVEVVDAVVVENSDSLITSNDRLSQPL